MRPGLLTYAFPRRERRTGLLATGEFLDRPLGAVVLTVFFGMVFLAAAPLTGDAGVCAIGRDCRCGTIASVGARRVMHREQRPSRSALSSLATSSDPASSLPQ